MRFPLTFAPIALAALLASPALADSMTLSGTGTVRAAPDMATVTTGVTTQGETAREALDANSTAMADLVAALRDAGLENRDIQTSNFTVSPQYVYSDQRDESGYTLPPQIQGYEVSNAVTIVVRDLEQLGSVLDQAVTVGANTINSVSFAVAETGKLEEEARKLAVADALAKARTYAEAAGVRLGSIESIRETDMAAPPMPMYQARAMSVSAEMAVPVEAGEMTYSITTTISWDIDD
ncbi:MAG TPA: SIMPL domain-containing protein [Pelagibacterium sp.]|uniref:SIMPL domain-containing protein n=1 Tax=Pelagibacterium sp. TaxID=1967288 RepID=UPI002C867281|nr:SIMPL domain-containing protein [Pelagibacterium sp.]HWJ87993.1 SIMPL domain-containing protein [Pelagibacterium sp.]